MTKEPLRLATEILIKVTSTSMIEESLLLKNNKLGKTWKMIMKETYH